MSKPNKISDYIKTVCEQIRWKKAHAAVSKELEDHIIDQKSAYLDIGIDEDKATDEAISQMGDPVVVGTQLDGTYRPKPDWGMLLTTAALVIIGTLIYMSFMKDTGGLRWIARYGLTQIIGLGFMIAVYFMDFSWFSRYAKVVYFSLLILTTVCFALLQLEIRLEYFYYPAVLTLLFPIGFAGIVYLVKNKGYKGIILCEIAFLLPALMLLLMRLRSQFILFAATAFVILCIVIAKGWFKSKKLNSFLLVIIPTIIALLLVAIIILNDNHKTEVIREAFSTSYDIHNIDSFNTEIKMTLDGSIFIGKGTMPNGNFYGPGYSTFSFLTSMIFYYGWISVIPILGIVAFFIINGFRLCLKQKNGLALLISTTIMMFFTVKTILYLLTNFGINLVPSLSIPFVIQFDSHEYIVDLVFIGLLLSVFRTGHVVRDNSINTIGNRLSLN